jgi:hypothetical protein
MNLTTIIPLILPYLSKMISVNSFNVLDTMPLLNLTLITGVPQGFNINIQYNNNYTNCDIYYNSSSTISTVFGCDINTCNSSWSSINFIKGNSFTQNYGEEFSDIFQTNRMIAFYCYSRYEIIYADLEQIFIDENKMKFLNSLNESELLSFIENNGQMFLSSSVYGGEISCSYIVYESMLYPTNMNGRFLETVADGILSHLNTKINNCPSMNTILNTQEPLDDLVSSVIFSVIGGNPSLFNNSFDDWYSSVIEQPALIEWFSSDGMNEIVEYDLMNDIMKSVYNIKSYYSYERTLYLYGNAIIPPMSSQFNIIDIGNTMINIIEIVNTTMINTLNQYITPIMVISIYGKDTETGNTYYKYFNPPIPSLNNHNNIIYLSISIISNNMEYLNDGIFINDSKNYIQCSSSNYIYSCSSNQNVEGISINRCYNQTEFMQC